MNLYRFQGRTLHTHDHHLTVVGLLGEERPFDRDAAAVRLRDEYDKALEENPKLTIVCIDFEPTPQKSWTAAPIHAWQDDVIWAADLLRGWGFTGHIGIYDCPLCYPLLHRCFVASAVTDTAYWWECAAANPKGWTRLAKMFRKTSKSWRGVYDVVDILFPSFYVDAGDTDPVLWMPEYCRRTREITDKRIIPILWSRDTRENGKTPHSVEVFRRQAEGVKACDVEGVTFYSEPWDNKPGQPVYVPDTAQVAAAVEVLRGAA